ncbi:MAG: hypothetical protein JWM31_1071, partial [Solirubrobacterales bacterium]|nr:hypothetical protein [Solirubrobacterales bacterium]
MRRRPFDGARRRAPASSTWFAGFLSAALSIVATLSVAHDAHRDAHRLEQTDLHLAADATRTATGPVLDALEDLVTLYAPARPVPDGQLTLAAGKLLRRRVVTVVSVLREVEDVDREAFERRFGPILGPDGRRAGRRRSYTVIVDGRSRGADGRLVRPRPRYVDVAADATRAPAL